MVYVVRYHTESGDEGFLGVFTEEPNDSHLSTLVRKNHPDEIVDGVSYLSWVVHHLPISELPPETDILEYL